MTIEYKRDLNSNYMILRGETAPDLDSYQVRMIQANRIPGLLPVSIREMDNKALYYYDITSKQSLHAILEHHMVSGRMLQDLFRSLFQLLDAMQDYLLSPDGLLLSPDLIYADGAWEHFIFTFLPGEAGEGQSLSHKIKEMMESILPKLDHSNQQGVVLGYGLYREVTGEQFSLSAMKTLVYQNMEDDLSEPDIPEKNSGLQKTPDQPDVAFRSEEEWEQEEEKEIREAMRDFSPEETKIKRFKGTGLFSFFLLFGLFALGAAGVIGGYLVFFFSGIFIGALLLGGSGAICLAAGFILMLKRRTGKKMPDKKKQTREVFREPEEENPEKSENFEKNRKFPEVIPEDYYADPFKILEQEDTYCPKNAEQAVALNNEAEKIKKKVLYEVTEVLYTPPAPSSRIRLVPESEEYPVIEFGEKTTLLIGKLASAADLVLEVKTVSRMHAKLEMDSTGKEEPEVYLSDLNSRNGTFVNGIMLQNGQRQKLNSGDEILFANVRYFFDDGENNM